MSSGDGARSWTVWTVIAMAVAYVVVCGAATSATRRSPPPISKESPLAPACRMSSSPARASSAGLVTPFRNTGSRPRAASRPEPQSAAEPAANVRCDADGGDSVPADGHETGP